MMINKRTLQKHLMRLVMMLFVVCLTVPSLPAIVAKAATMLGIHSLHKADLNIEGVIDLFELVTLR